MTIVLGTPGVDALGELVHGLGEWQREGDPIQLHPGDLGWFWRYGAEVTADAVRTWRRDGRLVAAGLLDEATVLRLAVAPDAVRDPQLADRLVDDLTDPSHGVLPTGRVNVEVPPGALVDELLMREGWITGEPWTPLRQDLAQALADPGVRIEHIGAERAQERVAVHRASFDRSTFTDDLWRAMAGGLPYTDARCLVAYDEQGIGVAAVTVWSAGAGRPGLIEPLGTHRDHRGHGYGRAISLAAAAALRELGSSSALVCTPSANVGGIATYRAAGFEELPQRPDRCRET